MSRNEPILAVDDSAPIREMIVSVLAPHGHRVITAGDGREALEIIRSSQTPLTILLDVVMPLLDGIGVCRAVSQDPHMRAVGHKIILMSSSVRLSDPGIPPTAGQLAKPFTRHQLLDAVEAARHRD